MAKFNFWEKSPKDKEAKGSKEGSKKEETADKKQMKFKEGGAVAAAGCATKGKEATKHFAAGGLAKTQSNLKKFGRGVAKVMNQKTGGKMKCGGSVRGK